MRTNRLLSIVLFLQLHKQMTTRKLAEQLEVSERTIHRDMELLSAEGFPIYSVQGKYGGWRLLDDYETKIVHLNKGEFPVLFVRPPEKMQQELGIDKDIDLAQMKLLSILPDRVKKDAKFSAERIYLDTANWHPTGEDHPYLSQLITAIWEEQTVKIEYLRRDGTARERLVNPLGLVAKGSTWYLVASIAHEIRTYRVARIQSAAITEEPFMRPHDFDLAAYWKQSTQQFVERLPQYHVQAKVDSRILHRLSYAGKFPKIEIHEEDADGWTNVSLQFQIEQEACAYIMGFGSQIEVLEPRELRAKVKRLAREIIDLYPNEKSE